VESEVSKEHNLIGEEQEELSSSSDMEVDEEGDYQMEEAKEEEQNKKPNERERRKSQSTRKLAEARHRQRVAKEIKKLLELKGEGIIKIWARAASERLAIGADKAIYEEEILL
jgi:hypothetical protein